jgi:hypothetical protein
MILLQLTYACFRFVYNWWLKTCLGWHDYQWEYLYVDGWLTYLKLMVWRNFSYSSLYEYYSSQMFDEIWCSTMLMISLFWLDFRFCLWWLGMMLLS